MRPFGTNRKHLRCPRYDGDEGRNGDCRPLNRPIPRRPTICRRNVNRTEAGSLRRSLILPLHGGHRAKVQHQDVMSLGDADADPGPPQIALSDVQHTTASTGRSSPAPSKIAAFLACNLRTAGEQRFHAGWWMAATAICTASSDGVGTRQSGPADGSSPATAKTQRPLAARRYAPQSCFVGLPGAWVDHGRSGIHRAPRVLAAGAAVVAGRACGGGGGALRSRGCRRRPACG